MTDFKQGLIFAIFVVVLQQVDGNIIGPVILGDRLKISSMWILFAILIGGGFFGVPGMILGAPCFACMYALIGTICKDRLEKKKLPLQTAEYYAIEQALLDEDGVIRKETAEDKQIKASDERKDTESEDNKKE